LRNFGGIFRVGLIQRWLTTPGGGPEIAFFGPKPAGVEQFSKQKRRTGEPKTRRRCFADQCGALAAPEKNEVAFQVGFEIQILGTFGGPSENTNQFYRSTFQRI